MRLNCAYLGQSLVRLAIGQKWTLLLEASDQAERKGENTKIVIFDLRSLKLKCYAS